MHPLYGTHCAVTSADGVDDMARLNPRRRALAKQAQLFREIVDAHGKAHDDSHKLQQGRVASSCDKLTRVGGNGANPVHLRPYTSFTCAPDWFIGKDGKSKYQGHK